MICVNDKGGKTSPFFTFPEIEKVDIHAKLTTQNVPVRPTINCIRGHISIKDQFYPKKEHKFFWDEKCFTKSGNTECTFLFLWFLKNEATTLELKTMRFFKNEATTLQLKTMSAWPPKKLLSSVSWYQKENTLLKTISIEIKPSWINLFCWTIVYYTLEDTLSWFITTFKR